MEEAGDRVVVGDGAERALVVSETKFSGAELVSVVAAQGGDVKGMDEPADGSIALRLELRAGGGNDLIPLLAAIGSVVVWYQNVGCDQSAAGLRRKRCRSGIAGLGSGQRRAEFGA